MAQPYINPLGFIDRPTQDGAIIILTNPEESLSLRPDTPITVWRYSPEHLALGKLRGRITTIGYTTATFVTDETEKDPRWPDENLVRAAAPVFLALEGTFEPGSQQEAHTGAGRGHAPHRPAIRRIGPNPELIEWGPPSPQ